MILRFWKCLAAAVILLCIGTGPLFMQEKAAEQKETADEDMLNRYSRIFKSFTSEPEKIKTIEKLGSLKHIRSAELLEKYLLFKWEKGLDNSHIPSHRRHVKERKLIQSRESAGKLRAKAAESLGKLGFERSIPILVKVAKSDSNSVVREHSLKALMRFRDPTLTDIYSYTAVSDSIAANRIHGVKGMTLYPARIRGQVLKKILNDTNIMVRLAGIRAVGVCGRKDFAGLVIATARDAQDEVKRKIADALSCLDTDDAAELLLFLAQSRNKRVSLSAVRALSLNTRVNRKSYMRLASRLTGQASMIYIKSAFRFWNTIQPGDYTSIDNNVATSLKPVLLNIKKKVDVRRKTSELTKMAEKIKLNLTEWQKQCKL